MREIDLGLDFDRFNETSLHARRAASRNGDTMKKTWSSTASVSLKYAIDAVLAVTALLVLAPMILMLAAMLLVLQGRPIFVAHRRIGKYGVTFPCLKFRTMVPNADEVLARHLDANPRHREEWVATRKLRDDPRVTPFGALLRKSSIDEIPQLVNVLRGQMSLVGPRPIVGSEAELYGAHFSDYIRVRPGLTGLWQVSGRSDTSYSERVELDVLYVRERSILGDLAIMLKTIPVVLRSRGSC
jgi:exopolysaccharide production protein ExoY